MYSQDSPACVYHYRLPHFLPQASFEQLRCDEFRDLLRLVTVCPLEKLDPQLSALRRQTKKWFRRLMRFAQNLSSTYTSVQWKYNSSAKTNLNSV